MRIDGWTIALQIINFVVLVWLLQRFLYRPVLAMIDARKAEARRELDAARDAEAKAKATLATVEAERAGIEAERQAALKAASSQAQALVDARRAQAERDAQSLLAATRQTLAREREDALQEARRVALDLAAAFTTRILADVPPQCRADAWLERIEQHIAALPKAEHAALAQQLAEGGTLTVVTASALSAATTAQWKDRLRAAIGPVDDIAFDIAPELIAGAELHLPTAILRFSARSALDAARSELEGHVRPG